MFHFVQEGSDITPGISVDKQHKILFLMFGTYNHRWCFRLRWHSRTHKPIFKLTHWTREYDEHILKKHCGALNRDYVRTGSVAKCKPHIPEVKAMGPEGATLGKE